MFKRNSQELKEGQKKPLHWYTVVFIVVAGIAIFLFSLHLLLNNRNIQRIVLNAANQYFGISLKWQKLKFNGATGHFSGDNLSLEIPKAKIKISLREFKLAIDPLRLLIKKVRLIYLEAQGLTIEMEELPKRETKKKVSPRNIMEVINLLSIDRAEVKQINVKAPNETVVTLQRVGVRAKIPLLFYKRGIKMTVDMATYLSPKFDLFVDQIETSGSFNIKYNLKTQRNEPDFDGRAFIQSALFGFKRTPTPWNPSLAWDESLISLLEKKYPDGIPNNRTFGHLEYAELPFYLGPSLIQIKGAALKAFGGRLAVNTTWNRVRGDASFNLTTVQPLKMNLLPLGKAKFGDTFETAKISIRKKGRIKSLSEGDLKGKIKIELENNLFVPHIEKLTLTSDANFKDGTLEFPNLNTRMADGVIQGKGSLNLLKKTVNSTFTGQNLDVQTIVRFFSKIDIPGKADVTGKIFGPLNNPSFEFNLSSPEAGYETLTFGSFKGQLKIKDRRLTLQGSTILEGKGTGTISLNIKEVFKASKQTIDLKTDFKNLPLGPLFKSKNVSGSASGYFNLFKDKKKYDGKGNIEATDIKIQKISVKSLSGTLALKNKTLTIRPIRIVWSATEPASVVTRPLIIKFDPSGFTMEGWVLPTVSIEGEKRIATPDILQLKLKAANTPLKFLNSIVPLDVKEFTASGSFDVRYSLPSPADSKITSNLTAFQFSGEENEIRLSARTRIDYENQKIVFHNSRFAVGTGHLTLNGPLGIQKDSNMRVRGSLDLSQLTGVIPILVEGGGVADIDLAWKESLSEPSFDGKITFKSAALLFRGLRGELTETNGTLRLTGSRIQFDRLNANYDDAPMTLQGWVEWKPPQISGANLKMTGQEILLSKPDTWRLFTDADVHLKGSGGQLRLSGVLSIVEGLYYKDFSLSQFVLKPVGVIYGVKKAITYGPFENMALDLRVKGGGEFEVRNNLAEIILRSDLHLKGTVKKPNISGIVDVVEGEIHALGIDFENATGFASFNQAKGLIPYLEFQASRDLQNFEIRAKLVGYADNLSLNLESTPALNRNDIVSLIAYGRTPDQLTAANQSLFSTTAIASQVVGLLQRPVSKATHLDIVRLETDYTRAEATPSRFSIGKRLSDRFSLAFTTDLSIDEAQKGFQIEYLLFDNLLLKGIKDTGSQYRFDLTLRLQTY